MQKRIIITIGTTIALLTIGYILKKHSKKSKLRKKILESGTNDYSGTAKDIIVSMKNAKALYKDLISKSHPDRFPNDLVKQVRAAEITVLLIDAKRNYRKLIELKQLVDTDLK
jgi:hypothetical protein